MREGRDRTLLRRRRPSKDAPLPGPEGIAAQHPHPRGRLVSGQTVARAGEDGDGQKAWCAAGGSGRCGSRRGGGLAAPRSTELRIPTWPRIPCLHCLRKRKGVRRSYRSLDLSVQGRRHSCDRWTRPECRSADERIHTLCAPRPGRSPGREQGRGAPTHGPREGPRAHDTQGGTQTQKATRGVSPCV